MAAEALSDTPAIDISEEDALRAHLYRLLASYMTGPPSAALLKAGAALEGDESDLGKAIGTFAHLCSRTSEETVDREYHDLFVGVGRGELLPYGSYYLTGFLNEKPLAKLRNAMREFGIERDEEAVEPEDHIASLCEMMAGLIDGSLRPDGEPITLAQQKEFYDAHVSSWGPHFFRDLEAAKSSVLYAGLGSVGRVFLEIETTAFSMI